jgi:hypothetical protein
MLNLETSRTIMKMAKGFSEYFEINALMSARCIKAATTRSDADLCKEVEVRCWTKEKEWRIMRMSSGEVEVRLKETGLWQVVQNAMTNVSPAFVRILDSMLIGSFGYAEVESIIRKRAIEAVEKRSMDPLYKGINTDWRNGSFDMEKDDVVERLKEKGIWQIVENEIKK